MNEREARHLAFLIPTGAGGGVQRVMTTLAAAMAKRGRQVDLVVGKAKGPFVDQLDEHVRLVSLKKAPPFGGRLAALKADPGGLAALAKPFLLPFQTSDMVARLPALTAYLRENQPDILMSAKVHTNLTALLASRAAKVGTKIIVSERGDYRDKLQASRRWRWRHITPLMRRLYPDAASIVSVSEDLAERLPGYTGINREQIRVLHNPVVTPELQEQAAKPVDHPWFAPDAPPVVLGAGRLETRKGFADLIKAFARLAGKRPHRLMIFGEGKERGALERLVGELGLENKVALPGWTGALFAHMAKSALFVLPSSYEGLPGVLIQALACGCPVVSNDCPTGPREILKDGRHGRLVPMGDIEAMAQAMIETLNDPPSSEALRRRADDFSLDRAVARYLDLFEGLMRQQPAGLDKRPSGDAICDPFFAIR